MSERLYQPYYCEENVWQFLRSASEENLTAPHAIFVSSPERRVALWNQKLGSPLVWDYHVVAADLGSTPRIFDFDTTLPFGCPAREWLVESFPFAGAIPPELEPTFRVVSAAEMLAAFMTDRSHMRGPDGEWLAPPPPWPAPSERSNLWDFVEMSDEGAAPGELHDLRSMLARVGAI